MRARVVARTAPRGRAPSWRELFEPRVLSIGGGSIWLRGFERVGVAAVVQEWRLDVRRVVKPGGHYGPPLGEVRPSL